MLRDSIRLFSALTLSHWTWDLNLPLALVRWVPVTSKGRCHKPLLWRKP